MVGEGPDRPDREEVEGLLRACASRWAFWREELLRIAGYRWHLPPDEAEAVVGEALARIHRGLPGFGYRSRLKTWMIGILQRAYYDWLRAKRRRERSLPPGDPVLEGCPARGPAALDELIMKERCERIRREIERICERARHPDRWRLIVKLCFDDGVTGAEVARMLGVRENYVHLALCRLREKLRARLDPETLAGLGLCGPRGDPDPKGIGRGPRGEEGEGNG